jgi:hypothetical protein
MPIRSPSERKSADSLAFQHYLRTGQKLTAGEWRQRVERKFNPYHDERGRFTFATGGAAMAAPAPRAGGGMRQVGRGGALPSVRPPTLPRTRVAAMPGYPEGPRTAWRSSNDLAFIAAADFYNKKYGLKPSDEEFRTPEFLKAWAMRESGGEGNEREFRTDPFQVNNPGDWPEIDNAKQRIAGLRKGERMTPAKSAYAALEWLRYKSYRHDTEGRPVEFFGNKIGLQSYNTVTTRTRQSGNLPHKVWYAETILQMERDARTSR